jgi:5,10-methenyltetrahydromethanopterin hydrogenase
MNVWEYKVTNHVVEELGQCIESQKSGKVISCDAAGGCMVNDVCKVGTESLAKALNELGKEGWELIMTTYHHGELLCIWKRQQ